MADEKTFMRPSDLARRWNISTRTLWLWRKEKRGPSFIDGETVLYELKDILEYERKLKVVTDQAEEA